MQRQTALQDWARHTLADPAICLVPITGDASFRRYFRLQQTDHRLIAVDAPPDTENTVSFVAIARAFAALGIRVPEIIAVDLAQGFLLLSDLGDRLYTHELNADTAEHLYQTALATLTTLQRCRNVTGWSLPHFDATFIAREWQLFQEWFLQKHCQLNFTVQEQYLLTATRDLLTTAIITQPQVCVHRDYHSRNLLVLENDHVGVLDFQDAVWGAITYDAVSLLRDCYVTWPREKIAGWIRNFYTQLCEEKLLSHVSFDQFLFWFDLQGIQRNLKAIGIFARLKHLYQKPNYLQHIPTGLHYVLDVSADYVEFKNFHAFLKNHLPNFIWEKQHS